jgi:shikimate dehydrogenase
MVQNKMTQVVAKYAVLGWPIQHSVSPQMQGAAFDAAGIAATYEKIAVKPEDLPNLVQRLRRDRYAGWNITVPHKERIIDAIDDIDPDACLANSVNTVVNHDGRLVGYSTDGYGLATAIDESFNVPVKGGSFAFCGAGGAARATAVYFAQCGASRLTLINRTLAKAEAVAAIIAEAVPECAVNCLSPNAGKDIREALADCDVLIQSTSLGLHAGDPMPLAPELIPPTLAVMEMIYRSTPLLRAAKARGCRTADGRGMLLHQGALSFELWTGRKAPVEIMRQALDQALA